MSKVTIDDLAAAMRKANAVIGQLRAQIQVLMAQGQRPLSTAEEIDAINGRRMEGTLSGEIAFDATVAGNKGNPITMQVSQDGPFVMTHYPMVVWRPTAPDNTTNLNRWRPIASFPLPDQVIDTDIIDIGYELQDGGNQRLLQNSERGPLLSRPDNIVPTPIPTLWSPASVVKFIPYFWSLTWNSATPPTAGVLHVDIPGYRIVNM